MSFLFAIVHFNTPDFLSCLMHSVVKHHKDAKFVVFDNSDKKPFKYNNLFKIDYYDNTSGQIIDFEKELQKYPERFVESQKRTGVYFGSAKHAMSIDWLCKNIKENFVLLDSDVILKCPIDFIDDRFITIGETTKDFTAKTRILPFCNFINVEMMKEKNISYFDGSRCHALTKAGNMYDTGASFYEDVSKFEYGLKEINESDYIEHYAGASWPDRTERKKKVSQNQTLTPSDWLLKYSCLWMNEKKSTPKEETKMNKIVLYTCITGGYDIFNFNIEKKEDGIDYVLFTDDKNLECKGWEIRGIPSDLIGLSKVKQARMLKILPHKYLSGYDISIWMDASTIPVKSIHSFLEKYDLSKHFLYVRRHPQRNCLYEEEKVVTENHIDKKENTFSQIQRYKKEGFPENFGLAETRILLRKHNEKECKLLMNLWASELLKGSFRDQLSFTYCVWKLKSDIGWLNDDVFSYRYNGTQDFCMKIRGRNHVKNNNYKDGRVDFMKDLKTTTLSVAKQTNCNLENLKTIQEKLIWLNSHDEKNDLKAKCSDKLALENYCIEKLGKNLCVPKIKIYNSADEINFSELPQSFVLKCNHGSGFNIIVKDKNEIFESECKKKLAEWLEIDYSSLHQEFFYSKIDRKIFVEPMLEADIIDYKFWCFNGKPMFFTINDGHGYGPINHYSMTKKLLPLSRTDHPANPSKQYKFPVNFDEMVKYAIKLSEDFKFVRVDFFENNNKVYLGELTFCPGAAKFHYVNKSDDLAVGNLLKL